MIHEPQATEPSLARYYALANVLREGMRGHTARFPTPVLGQGLEPCSV